MSNSYRIRTTPGVDKSIRVRIDQDFEYLEILSLKLLQSQIYTRKCTDYGVIVGRVSINNGFGVPNSRVSIFIPLSSDDEENNPVLADLYPYKTLSQTNDIGYRYNLLPTEPSYSNHVPTGSFFTKNDVLTNSTKIEIFDKYFKYTAVTNESGDYMIFGVPVGSQTIVVNVDLSDIGEFSLSPQDMIRMGIATSAQVNGTKFNSSTNLNELPQIITINRTLEVEPLWGDESVCNLGITRTDFDLSAEKNINIQPTSIFLGSIFSSNEDQPLKRKCKPSLKSGALCNLVAGPGQIQAIRQTIRTDINGRPALEIAPLEEGGQVIDDNGTWMIDVPMNLDYVVTNEFGEQVISKDPKKGIPTRGKYRFKVMWNQPPGLGENIKRATFLVPNVKEYGWITADGTDPLTGQKVNSKTQSYNGDNPCNYASTVPTTLDGKAGKSSYAFSLDWDDYGPTGTTIGDQMILEAINCQDRFFDMQYNKVYTVSQLITEYRKGILNNRIVAIKNILDETCESTNNKFPANDGMYRFDIIFILFLLMINIMHPVIVFIVIIAHIFLWVQCEIILPIIGALRDVICGLADAICTLADLEISVWRPFGFLSGICNKLRGTCDSLTDSYNRMADKCKNTFLNLPTLTFPDCELCACEAQPPVDSKPDATNPLVLSSPNSSFGDILNGGSYGGPFLSSNGNSTSDKNGVFSQGRFDDKQLVTGIDIQNPLSDVTKGVSNDVSQTGRDDSAIPDLRTFTTDLPWHERFNLFNTKAKYFNNDNANNPGGGVNRIKVRFNTDINGGSLLNNTGGLNHLDNVIAVLVDATEKGNFKVGAMVTFVDPLKTSDTNLINVVPANDFGTSSITGSTIGTIRAGTSNKIKETTVQVDYANPNGGGNMTGPIYTITGNSANSYHKFPMDLEYYQVIENVSVAEYFVAANGIVPDLSHSFYHRVLNGGYHMLTSYKYDKPFPFPNDYRSAAFVTSSSLNVGPIRDYYKKSDLLRVVFLVRGVDPNSPKTTISYDLSMLYGKGTYGHIVRDIPNMRMNVPIQGGYKCVKHNSISINNTSEGYSNLGLFYDTFMWKPSVNSPGVPAGNDPFTNQIYAPFTADPDYRPVGYCDFQSFTTINQGYYSSVDESKAGNFGNYVQSNNGIRVNGDINQIINGGGTNAYTAWYLNTHPNPNIFVNPLFGVFFPFINDPAADNGLTTQLIFNKQNRGYFHNESIEGGNIAILSATRLDKLGGAYYLLDPKNYINSGHYYSYTYKSENTTPTLTIGSGGSGRQIVMRSDRLPSSSFEELGPGNVSYTLMANNNFSFYVISDDGSVSSLAGGETVGVGGSADSAASNAESSCGGDILGTLSCEGMIPLGCYAEVGGHVVILPKTPTNKDACYGNRESGSDTFGPGPKDILVGGCYRVVTRPIKTLGLDINDIIPEWKARITIAFAACRNVFSHSFTNNWVNGTLFAFSFANSRRFTPASSVPASTANKPYNCFCKNTIFLNTDSNNFYYRSSPYSYVDNSFVGRQANRSWYAKNGFGGNDKNLMYPTTIMDLGPRDVFTQEIAFSNDYDGYVMKSLNSTTFQDVAELLNVFILTRMVNKNFLDSIKNLRPVIRFFNRVHYKIDGDYAQSVSINSELGTVPFEPDNYDSCDIFSNGGTVTRPVFGIYYSSNTQIRDYVTPKRTIINDNVSLTLSNCAFEYFKVKTQTVPLYQWYIKKDFNGEENDETILFGPTPSPDSIFGSPFNEWSTDAYSGTTFFSHNYQNLDRLLPTSRYFRTNGNTATKYYRGNIYSVDNSSPPKQVGDTTYWDKNAVLDSAYPEMLRVVNTGAPFYFYFGLNKGKSAFDRFTKKWIDVEYTTD